MLQIGFSVDPKNKKIINKCKIIQIFVDDNLKFFNNKQLIVVHSSYKFTINDNKIFYAISNEVKILKNVTHPYGIVIHLNVYKKTRNDAFLDICGRIKYILKKYLIPNNLLLMLETSHDINHIGSTILDLYNLYNMFDENDKKYLFFCLDTSHIYLAGYPIFDYNALLKYLSFFDIFIGLDKIKLTHLNDIDAPIMGHHTPHLQIGKGVIFNDSNLELILSFLDFYNIPIILERKTVVYEELNFIKNKQYKKNFQELNKKKINYIKKSYETKIKNLINYEPNINSNDDLRKAIILYTDILDLLALPKYGIKKIKNILKNDIKKIDEYKNKYENNLKEYLLSVENAIIIKNFISKHIKNEHYFLGSLNRYLLDEKKNPNNFLRPPRDKYFIKDLDLLIINYENLDFLNIVKINYSGNNRKQFECNFYEKKFILDIFFCSENQKITYIFFLEGPYIKNIIYRKIAKKMGYTLNEYGLFKNNPKEQINLKNIYDLYKILQTKEKIFSLELPKIHI